jgi:ABC-type Fe3+-hydroxamate transport system substrate-binding protein
MTLLPISTAPHSLVSLVPSMTDSLLALGLGKRIVGITDFCPWPDEWAGVTRVGGPKDVDLHRILALRPELVIVNQEENSKGTVEALQAEGIPVWVTYPRTVAQSMEDLYQLASLFSSPSALLQLQWLERAIAWMSQSRKQTTVHLFCPVWRSATLGRETTWMTFSADTYAADVLRICGADNRLMITTGDRYPEVALEDIRAAAPDAILLPSEPFPFREAEAAFLQSELGLPAENIRLWDGRDLFWHGTRLGQAIQFLPDWIDFIDASRSKGSQ